MVLHSPGKLMGKGSDCLHVPLNSPSLSHLPGGPRTKKEMCLLPQSEK